MLIDDQHVPAIVYLSGPIASRPDLNVPAFDEARNDLRDRGYTVLCPSEASECWRPRTPPPERQAHMRRDFLMVMTAEEIAVLPGWEMSAGACTEVALALEIGLSVWDYETGVDLTDSLRGGLDVRRMLLSVDMEQYLDVEDEDEGVDPDTGSDCPVTVVPFKGASLAYCSKRSGHQGPHLTAGGHEW